MKKMKVDSVGKFNLYVLFTEDYIPVQPENSEAQRRIGAKGTNSVLHVSPYGITLALQVMYIG